MLNGLDLFSGIGGIAIALADYVRPVAYCEYDSYAQAVLLSRMRDGALPIAAVWDDVRTLNTKELPSCIDIIYGGFPCQDISIAGNGKGLAGERSGLFFEIIRLARDIRPRFVFLENVPAITYRGLERICLEFTSIGYDSRWTTLSAGELGAPHLRERWWLLAHADGKRLQESGIESQSPREDRTKPWRATFSRIQAPFWNKSPSDISRMDDGIRPKIHRTRALGNAVVPLQAKTAFERLMGLSA